jgi:hypothetical protein
MRQRDEKLGRALRDLDVPEHDPAFFAELRGQLAEVEPHRVRRERRRPLVLRAGAVAMVATVVVAVALFRDGGGEGPAPRLGTAPATAAEVRATALRSWAALRSLSGRAVVRVRIAPEEPVAVQRFTFAMTARGDLITRDADGRRSVYDAAAGTEVILGDPNVGQPYMRRGLAPAAPDAHPSEELLQRSLGAVVRALRAGRSSSVREVQFEGRPAWELRVAVPVNKLGYSGDRLQVVVDRESGLPLRSRETYRGRLVQQLRLMDLRVDGDVSVKLPEVPAGSEPLVTDDGFRRTPAAEVAAAAGYPPLVPGWVPKGFTRAETATAHEARATGSEGMNPPSLDVVSAVWRRGLDRMLVTTRRVGPDPQAWADPLSAGEGYLTKPEPVRLESGALAGASGELLLDPRATPHLWARTDKLVVTVSGDLSRAELLRVASSLRRGG